MLEGGSGMMQRLAAGVMAWTTAASLEAQTAGSFVNFEGRHCRPLALSQDGRRLFAVNTPDCRLSVFDVSNPSNPVPVLIREIPVGVEPVSVQPLTDDEVWVVNEVSDSISVVSVSGGIVTGTIPCKDEPADVVFSAGKAFVSCSRNNLVRVFDAETHAELASVPVQGLNPRSLAVSADGSRVFAAMALSGNRTTLLPVERAPNQPPPTNPNLPPPPRVGLIVSHNDSRLNPMPLIPDHDVAVIDAADHSVVRYFDGIGTINFAMAARPGGGELWVTNTDARNLTRFEPNLRGHAVDNRLTRIIVASGATTAFDLNPGINYALLPNPGAKANALAQPAAIVFEPGGGFLWLASFGTDRLAKVDASSGAIVRRIDLDPAGGGGANPRGMRGPRGLALRADLGRLYVLNRISNTITVINTQTSQVLTEHATGSLDPTPGVIRQGRGFLYDARLSGNGTMSCASCHVDGDRDDLAWDLGDPGGHLEQVTSPTIFQTSRTFDMHPMKGPMTTQSLRGLAGTDPLHWRGDRATFGHFNGAFASLLGGTELSTADMNTFRDFINTIVYQPNPNQNLDRTLPPTFAGGDPNAGRHTYLNEFYQPGLTCNTCHTLPTGTNKMIIDAELLDESQSFKVPQLRNIYQKRHFVRSGTTVSLSGFGLVHDGQDPDMVTFLSRAVFGVFANDSTRKRNLDAFVQCIDTGTAPACGHAITLTAATLAASDATWTLLETQAAAGHIDLVAHGTMDGHRHGWHFRPVPGDYAPDESALGAATRLTLSQKIAEGAVLTIIGVPPGSGARLGTDRDLDALADLDEPLPVLDLGFEAEIPRLTWPAAHWWMVLERNHHLDAGSWEAVNQSRVTTGGSVILLDFASSPRAFFRLRRP